MFQADELLLLALREAQVRFVVIGGIAVGVHGYLRATKDLDVVPDPEPENLARLSSLLRELDAEHVGVADFAADEFPYDPTDPEQLAQGANFRLETRLGPLDIMQWVAGIDEDPAYPALARAPFGRLCVRASRPAQLLFSVAGGCFALGLRVGVAAERARWSEGGPVEAALCVVFDRVAGRASGIFVINCHRGPGYPCRGTRNRVKGVRDDPPEARRQYGERDRVRGEPRQSRRWS